MADEMDDAIERSQECLKQILLSVKLTPEQRKFAVECARKIRNDTFELLVSQPNKNKLGPAIIAIALAYYIGPVDAWGCLPPDEEI